MEKYSAECYSWFKLIHIPELNTSFLEKLYWLICENKLTIIELFSLSYFEFEDFFSTSLSSEECKSIFNKIQTLNKQDLHQAFENIWENTYLIPWLNKNYPKKIRECLKEKAPVLFFARGHLPLVNNPNILIIGETEISDLIIKRTWSICTRLTTAGFNILSSEEWGTALHAHKSALRTDGTITCILSDGFSDFTIRENRKKYSWQINSLFLSASLPHTKTKSINSLKLMAAWAEAVIFISPQFSKDTKYQEIYNFSKTYSIPLFVYSTEKMSPFISFNDVISKKLLSIFSDFT